MTVQHAQDAGVQHFRARIATSEKEREQARKLRQEVFCNEQRVFDGDDTDPLDRVAMPLVALRCPPDGDEQVVGTVRIHEDSPGVWFGSRLAVAAHVRSSASIGSALIRLAVGIAHAHGCRTFLAHVQGQNVPLFERLHWESIEELILHGRPHHLMRADLDHYPPIYDGDTGLTWTRSEK